MHLKVPLETRSLVRAVCDAENAADWDVWRELVAEDVIIDHPIIGVQIGLEPNIAIVAAFHAAVTDYCREQFDVVSEGSSCAYRFTLTGRLTGELDGRFAADGRQIDLAGAVFCTQRAGRIVRVVELLTRNGLGPPRG